MIQTDTCSICHGGIYRDIEATWDLVPWLHMDPSDITRHEAKPTHRSSDD